MKISLEWLGDFVDLTGVKPEELALSFTMVAAEVENVEHHGRQRRSPRCFHRAAGGFRGVLAAIHRDCHER